MEPFIGQITMFGFNFAPRGWAFCNGQIMSISENSALFSLLGTTYGGDGRTTFALPDLRGRIAMQFGSGPGLTSHSIGQKGGVENPTLSVNQMPSHTHEATNTISIGVSDEDGTVNEPGGSILANSVNNNFSRGEADRELVGVAQNIENANTGGNQKVDSNGKVEEKCSLSSVVSISFSVDNTLWTAVQDNGSVTYISYSENEGKTWTRIEIQNVKISKIAATHLGSCFILTPQGAVHLVQKSGELKAIFDDGAASDLAVSPEGYIWIISRLKKEGGGNIVCWCALDNYVLQPAYGQPVAKKISAGPEGTARIITNGNEIASLHLNRMGGLETPGGEAFARDIATSCRSNTIWTISRVNVKKKKQHVLKFWNPDSDAYMKWHTVRDIEPILIAGGV
jgi:microcystin-dependent protein